MKRYRCHIFITFIVIIGFACSLRASDWDKESKQRKADYIYMEAQRQYAIENTDAYYELQRRAYTLDRSNSDVGFYLGYHNLAISNGDSTLVHDGLSLMEAHFRKSPEDYFGTYLYAKVNEQTGNKAKALKVWAALDSIYPERSEIGSIYAQSLGRTGDSTNLVQAIKIYDRMERTEGKSIQLSTGKMRVYFAIRDTASIVKEVHDLLKSSPMSSDYNVFAGDIYSLLEKKDSALYYFNRACEMDSTSGLAYYSRANYYKEQNDSMAYDREVFRALKQESLDLEAKLNLLTNYIRALYEDPEQQSRIQDLFAELLEQHPHEADIHDLYCSYLVAIKDYLGAAEQAGYVLDSDPSSEDRWRVLMRLYAQGGDYNRAIDAGKSALHYHPKSVMINFLIAIDYNSMQQPDSAISYLHATLDLTNPTDVEMQSQVLSSIGDSYYMKEEVDSAFAYYDRAIEKNPANLLALNNCAYYLACEGRDLDRAERMSAITIQEEPENDTSLDTYAWVLFKKKDYERAQHYINEAIKFSKEPSAELYHHAGDIYFMMGDPEKALEFWKKALELDAEDELLQRKVLHKTYFYK